MQEKYKKRYGMAMLVFLVILFGVIAAAVMNNGSRRQTTQKQVTSNRTVPEPTKTYDTEITGVVTGINTGLKNIKIYNISNDLDTILCEFSNKKDFSSRFFRYFKWIWKKRFYYWCYKWMYKYFCSIICKKSKEY